MEWDRFKLRWIAVGDLIKEGRGGQIFKDPGDLASKRRLDPTGSHLVKEISQNSAISRSIAYIHDRLREGKGISRSLEETNVFPPLAIHMIGVGEETGRLDEMLIKVAEAYEVSVQTTVKRVVSLLEPLIILVMGGIVFFIVISILLAILSINEIPF